MWYVFGAMGAIIGVVSYAGLVSARHARNEAGRTRTSSPSQIAKITILDSGQSENLTRNNEENNKAMEMASTGTGNRL